MAGKVSSLCKHESRENSVLRNMSGVERGA